MPPADGDSWETSVRSVTLCTRFHATLQVSLSFGPPSLSTRPREGDGRVRMYLCRSTVLVAPGEAKVVTTVARGCPPPQAPVVVVAGLSGGGGGRRPG